MSIKAKSIRLNFHSDKNLWCLATEVQQGEGLSGTKKQFVDIFLTSEQVASLIASYKD